MRLYRYQDLLTGVFAFESSGPLPGLLYLESVLDNSQASNVIFTKPLHVLYRFLVRISRATRRLFT